MSGQHVIQTDVVIIGGGLAGLSAAYELTGSGLESDLLEASGRLGGRSWGYFWEKAGQYIDLGASWLTPYFKNALEYVEKFELTAVESPTPQRYLTHFRRGIAHQRLPRAEDIAVLSDVNHKIHNVLASTAQTLSAHDVLTSISTSASTRDWHLAMQRYLAGADLQCVDAGHLLLDMDDLIDPEHYNIEIQGSMKQITTALQGSIGSAVHHSTPVTAVYQNEEGYAVHTARNTVLQASSVVFAVPLNVLEDITFDSRQIGSLAEFIPEGHSGASRKDWFILGGVEEHVRVFASEGLFGYFRTVTQLEDGSMLAVGLAPSHENFLGPAQTETEVRRYIPSATIRAHCTYEWTANPWAQGTWVAPPPGYYEALSAIDNTVSRLQIVGGDFCSEFPGTVEGAIRTGRQAARNILRHATEI